MKMEEKYRRRIALILCLSFILPNIMFTVPSKVLAATVYKLEVPAVVTSTTLNVREDAGTTAEKIGSITKNTKVTIIGQKITNGEIWYQIKTTIDKKAVTGYSSSVYLQIVPESGFFGAIDATSVTMNKLPSYDSDAVSLSDGKKLTLPQNREIWIIKEATQNGVKWFYIRITSGGKRYYGYVPASSVRLTGTKITSQVTPTPTLTPAPSKPQVSGNINLEALVTSTTLNVRKTPGTSGELITKFLIGQKVTILSEQMSGADKWYQVTATIDGKKITGYVHSDYIEIEVGSGFYAVVKPTAVTYKVSAGDTSKNQTYDSGKSITASKGTYVWVSKEETKDQDKWFRISKHADGKVYYGYVKANDLTIIGKKKPQATSPTSTPTPTPKPTQAPTQAPSEVPSGHIVNLSAVVTSTTLNIRKTPGTSGTLLTTVKNGQQVTILSEKMVGTEKWYEISSTVSGKKITGYVLSNYVKIDVGSGFYAIVKPTTVTYKVSAGSSKNQIDDSRKVITASKGTYVWVSKEETTGTAKWFRISKHADGKVYYGYVEANDLTVIGKKKPQVVTPTPTPTPKPTQAPTQAPSEHVINLNAAVTSTTLNIRKTPGTSGTLLTTVKNGQKVTILSEKMVGSEKWYEITTTVSGKKITGYVLSNYVRIDVGSGFYATVKPTKVTYKVTASTSAKDLTDINKKPVTAVKGTYVWVSKEETTGTTKWFRISKHADGKVYFGYVKATDLTLIGKSKPYVPTPTPTPTPKPTQPPAPTSTPTVTPNEANILAYVSASSLNLRDAAGTSSKVIATMPQNTQLVVLRQTTFDREIWYQVKAFINGKEITGFVYSPYVKLSLASKASAQAVTSGAIVYKTASTSSSVVATLSKNQPVNVVSEQTAYGVKWFQIELQKDYTIYKGYIPASGVVLVGNTPAFSTDGLLTPVPTATPKPTSPPKPTATPTPQGEIFNQTAVIKDASSLGVRVTASYSASFIKDDNGYPITLSTGKQVIAIKSQYAENIMWMMISFEENGKTYEGFINKAYVELTGTVVPGKPTPTEAPSLDFEAMLTKQGFPESYKPYLRELHKQFPNWQFEAYHTNLTWDEVIKGENVVGKNLITNSRGIEWKSLEPGAYNYATDSFVVYDGSYWVTASKDALAYYMDPRNFLTAESIFQFEVLTYKPEFQSLAGVENILKYTPLHNAYYTYKDANGVEQSISYAETFIKAAEYSNVSPYHLASRVKQEVVKGSNSLSSSVSGTVSGFEGYYNFYNIGAYHSTVPGGAIANGLKYAKYGSTNTALNKAAMIPWNNRYRAIVGGGYIIGNSYINRGQDTIYLQKFNVTPKSTYSHQYMANVEAAASESKKVYAGYSHVDELPIVFSIPVYKNMPTNAVARPTTAYNPNNYLKSLKVTSASGKTLPLTPSFDILKGTEYAIVLDASHKSVTISASCVNSKATVAGAGKYTLVDGINAFELIVTAQNGTQRTYTITIIRNK